MEFRWNEWNFEHVGKHGVSPEEAEAVVGAAVQPYPRRIADEKWLVVGPGRGGRVIQVIFFLDDDGTAYIIHARPLADREKRRHRRWRRR